MKTQHTPGPWFNVGKGQNIEVRYKTGVKLCGVGIDDLICMLPHHPDKKCHAQYEANATLIVAAPELLEALEAMLSTFEPSNDLPVMTQARTAIAKARGLK